MPGNSVQPVILVILDGWGEAEPGPHNAISQAQTPCIDRLKERCGYALLHASSEQVGLPCGQIGNSEVGHMTIGAGRVDLQDLPRIDSAFERARKQRTPLPPLAEFARRVRNQTGIAHLLGLVSPGGVHAHQNHIECLANMLAEHGVRVRVHAILDGRDTPPRSAQEYLARFQDNAPNAKIASLSGRYYAMDRDAHYDRTQKAFTAMLGLASSPHYQAAKSALAAAYEKSLDDEFVPPCRIGNENPMQNGDGLLCANFRSDRIRQILRALLVKDFDEFAREKYLKFSAQMLMTNCAPDLDKHCQLLFENTPLRNTLGEQVAKAGLRQLRLAETEKFAHISFFFNGGRERPFAKEERKLIPSPLVETYDLQPEMSAPSLSKTLIAAIESREYALIVVNYANPDMVGHTGKIKASIRAVESLDHYLGGVCATAEKTGAVLVVTADHGNAEKMYDEITRQPHTAHTTNPVPFIVACGSKARYALGRKQGSLRDIAPTILDIMGLDIPEDMTGRSLIKRKENTRKPPRSDSSGRSHRFAFPSSEPAAS